MLPGSSTTSFVAALDTAAGGTGYSGAGLEQRRERRTAKQQRAAPHQCASGQRLAGQIHEVLQSRDTVDRSPMNVKAGGRAYTALAEFLAARGRSAIGADQ